MSLPSRFCGLTGHSGASLAWRLLCRRSQRRAGPGSPGPLGPPLLDGSLTRCLHLPPEPLGLSGASLPHGWCLILQSLPCDLSFSQLGGVRGLSLSVAAAHQRLEVEASRPGWGYGRDGVTSTTFHGSKQEWDSRENRKGLRLLMPTWQVPILASSRAGQRHGCSQLWNIQSANLCFFCHN